MTSEVTIDIWRYYDTGLDSDSLIGYHVEADDGSIGKVAEATHDAGSGYIVVDTGPWIFGKKVLLPAGTISRVDSQAERVYVNRTKEQIKNSPRFDDLDPDYDDSFRSDVGSYYGPNGAGRL